eukprot:CAMPEP_0197390124 /NCGR_PEP_ID=MMETSP1165-20131217/2194_1 /TAXON_ID=284809 /ORGANISM="Chrysocystis fragilis, Strain CCMP3189" /LENGTH=169 /DNA_ID=CAMNT_0042915589 /DNA_START=64 /DNA_END=573 /DNA_ORIENTATION=+
MYLAPQYFGPRMRSYIKDEIVKSVEGTCLGREGYVIAVMELKNDDIDTGVVEYDTGMVSVNARYSAILLRPFKNEVVDAVVTQVNEIGFFSEAGPLAIFVSRHAMPEDLQDGYDADVESWISEDKEVEIKQRCVVRLKLLGVTCDTNEITAVGTIKDDYLGLISMGTAY